MNLIITSTGFSFNPHVQEEFLKMTHGDTSLPVAIITTAAEGKEENEYSKLAKKQFTNMGFTHVDFIDVETQDPQLLKTYKVLYVCGGNTFYLLHYIKQSKADVIIKELIANGVIYIGVSAGSIILSPTVDIAAAISPDPNDIGLTDLTGLNMVNFDTSVHYEPQEESEVQAYETKTGRTVQRLSNEQAIIKNDLEIKRIYNYKPSSFL